MEQYQRQYHCGEPSDVLTIWHPLLSSVESGNAAAAIRKEASRLTNERFIAAADYRCGIEGQYHARKAFKALRGMSNSAKRNVPRHRLRGKRQTGSHLKLLDAF